MNTSWISRFNDVMRSEVGRATSGIGPYERAGDSIALKLESLSTWIRQWDSMLIAYSGGVDSALLMAVASQELGPRALACIGISPSYPRRERDAAISLADDLGGRFRLVETDEVRDPQFIANTKDRCYHCKSALFRKMKVIGEEEGAQIIIDGNNADDLNDHRPGRIAAQENGVRSPLVELGLTKENVRALAKHLGLPVWDKPAMACLSSRVPHGSPIAPEVLARIEAAEDVLVGLGFRQFRVRHHDQLARIELLPEDLPRAMEIRVDLADRIRKVGYTYVSLDLCGFRGAAHPAPSLGPQSKIEH